MFQYYGASGVTVSPRWLGPEGFDRFLADMGPKPSPSHTIDRFPDEAGNYEPGNCRWASKREQGDRKKNLRLLTIDGVTLSAKRWAEAVGIPMHTLYGRLNRGWDPKLAVTTPIIDRHRSR